MLLMLNRDTLPMSREVRAFFVAREQPAQYQAVGFNVLADEYIIESVR